MRGFGHNERAGGVILHPTSLPGPHGIGDLGPEAHRWIDLLGDSGTGLWQVLPLGPTGFADSPYAALSSFAGNTILVSPESLVADGLIDVVPDPESGDETMVDFGAQIPIKRRLIAHTAAHHRGGGGSPELREAYDAFRATTGPWLAEYATFAAIKRLHRGAPWWAWEEPLRNRSAVALATIDVEHADLIDELIFGQFLFFRQWAAVRAHAAARGVRIIGDLPFFVAPDSADVWSQPQLFDLHPDGTPAHVAGVPPDYFSTTGQLWGNPQYRWERHAADGYAWWLGRLGATFAAVDIVRIDHFRAFADYWEIPGDAVDATSGRWRDGPGVAFFEAVEARFGSAPIIAEDLGELSARVPALLESVGIPGMRVLQFAFDGEGNADFLPDRYPMNTVAYTGTHDNDTTMGWWERASATDREAASSYLGADPEDPVASYLAALWGSAAMFTLAPLQDLLRLGREARMNTPGTTDGNWRWRATDTRLDNALVEQLRDLNQTHGRLSGSQVS